jgi:hypothetical protein
MLSEYLNDKSFVCPIFLPNICNLKIYLRIKNRIKRKYKINEIKFAF